MTELRNYRRRFSRGWALHYGVPLTTRVPALRFDIPLLRWRHLGPEEVPIGKPEAYARYLIWSVAGEVRHRIAQRIPEAALKTKTFGQLGGSEPRWGPAAREAIMHLRQAWIAHQAGNEVLFELECNRALVRGLLGDPMKIAGVAACLRHKERQQVGRDSAARRYKSPASSTADRDRRIKAAAGAGTPQKDIAREHRISDRQVRNILKPKRK